jgi:hypothetical protein
MYIFVLHFLHVARMVMSPIHVVACANVSFLSIAQQSFVVFVVLFVYVFGSTGI